MTDQERRAIFETLRCEECNGGGSIHSPIIGVTTCGCCEGSGVNPDLYLGDLFPDEIKIR